MIMVIRHVTDRTICDTNGRIIEEKGEVFVSHGVDVLNGKVVILPFERWRDFSHNCVLYEGEWYLK